MKKYLLLLVTVISLSSCIDVLKPNDLKNCVVIYKSDYKISNQFIGRKDKNIIDYMNLNDSTSNHCYVHEFWAKDWNVGDTIK